MEIQRLSLDRTAYSPPHLDSAPLSGAANVPDFYACVSGLRMAFRDNNLRNHLVASALGLELGSFFASGASALDTTIGGVKFHGVTGAEVFRDNSRMVKLTVAAVEGDVDSRAVRIYQSMVDANLQTTQSPTIEDDLFDCAVLLFCGGDGRRAGSGSYQYPAGPWSNYGVTSLNDMWELGDVSDRLYNGWSLQVMQYNLFTPEALKTLHYAGDDILLAVAFLFGGKTEDEYKQAIGGDTGDNNTYGILRAWLG